MKVFTLNSAYSQIGGFGRFQLMALLVFILVRNFGQYTVYLFGFNVQPQTMLCRNSQTSHTFQECTPEFICQNLDTKGFEYKQDKKNDEYLENWWIQNMYMCEPKSAVNSLVSYFFIGQGFGMFLFFLPDALGLKKALMLGMTVNIVNVYLLLYTKSMNLHRLGFLIQGIFHQRSTCTFLHLNDLLEDKYKDMAATLLSAFDSGCIMLSCLFFWYVDRDVNQLFKAVYLAGVAAFVLYVLFIPDSPRTSFVKDPNS